MAGNFRYRFTHVHDKFGEVFIRLLNSANTQCQLTLEPWDKCSHIGRCRLVQHTAGKTSYFLEARCPLPIFLHFIVERLSQFIGIFLITFELRDKRLILFNGHRKLLFDSQPRTVIPRKSH